MYQHILVPVDGSPTSQLGLDEALRLAALTKGRLRLIHVIDELSLAGSMGAYAAYSDWLEVLRTNGEELLDRAQAQAKAAGVEADTVLHDNFAGPVHELVIQEARKWPAHLIVIGTHGRRGLPRMVLGSSAEKILREAPVPVLLVRQPEAGGEAGPGAPA
ncbi:universal stress protein [Pigmentiphaga sp. CHJ604]|uniref:universal stress protein n=1 Tax=Pigmentiphaga sp. CHJ604 TaxID=3081984 RepID=UPI0030CDC94D